jgi:hydroxymethyl cephem carbamoyltransferase
MRTLSLTPGHDGAIALIADGRLEFSLEAEKDSFGRHEQLSARLIFEALQSLEEPPDVLALGGWLDVLPEKTRAIGAGYRGLRPEPLRTAKIFGRDMQLYSCSHERAHILGSVAMSPFVGKDRLAVLVWEGQIGAFYEWHGPQHPIVRHDVLDQPGARYAALFALADPAFPQGGFPRTEDAGKLMALAGCADSLAPSSESRLVVDSLLQSRALYPFNKARYRRAHLHNAGVPDDELARAARYLTDRLFAIFLEAARAIFPPGLALVIGGGCGLNCEWNTRWADSGQFGAVFVPPCPDDTGSAIGTAVDAAVQIGALCELDWDVYRGNIFNTDVEPGSLWVTRPLNHSALAAELAVGEVVAWVQGRYEIGPRALGNRSLLARASDRASHRRLNTIKQRESYRPIAPVCLEEDLGKWFDRDHPDPHMLYFRRVRYPDSLPAVTHRDGTARVQSVNTTTNPALDRLLRAYRTQTNIGVLCNTSLNFKGRGFINRTSDLIHFCDLHAINHAVVGNTWYVRSTPPTADASRGTTAVGEARPQSDHL